MSYFQKILDKSLEYCKAIFTSRELNILLSDVNIFIKKQMQ